MKRIFIPAKYKTQVEINLKEISIKLPKNIAIGFSVQFQQQALSIKSELEKDHEITGFVQVLGCSQPKFPLSTEAILLVGSGKFHAIGLAFETKLPVYVLENNTFNKITEEEIKKLETKEKTALLKYLHAEKVGFLISTKPGQENLKRTIDFKNSQKDKESYLFITNELNTSEFENFPQIQAWVNTACPRMDMTDASIINISKIEEKRKI